MPQFPAVFNLSTLDGTNGFQIDGNTPNDRSGRAVAGAGDVNGDGFADLIIGAPLNNPFGYASGSAFVVFGKASGFGASFSLSNPNLNGTDAFGLFGTFPSSRTGHSVSDAGDVNGDGFGDVIIGAYAANPNGSLSGATYVVFGKASGFANVNLGTLNGTDGFRINGEVAGDISGWSVSGAGDINGDGFDDLLIGAHYSDAGGTNTGAIYVVFGKAAGFTATLNLSALDGTNGVQINGEAGGDLAGFSVSDAGDVNGDGLDDFLIGAESAASNEGAAYVVFGKIAGYLSTTSLAAINGVNGFQIDGDGGAGYSVSAGGDVNGDGFADVLVGADADTVNSTTFGGATYVVFGKGGGFAATLNASSLDGVNGFRIAGEENGVSGRSVSGAGDVNGDGFDDILIGDISNDENGNNAGASYLVFGKASGFGAVLQLATLNGTNGFQISGEALDDQSGRSVSGAGDINGDGFADLLVGTQDVGLSYVVFGHATGTINRTGTEARDVFAAGEWDDTFNTLGGDDWVRAGDGDDFVSAGQGDDLIEGGGGSDELSGGSGLDTFIASFGDDTVSGGSNGDNLDFADITGGGVTVNLQTGAAIVPDIDSSLVFSSIERLFGTASDDQFTGNARVNLLNGRNGDDTLSGGAGDDILTGGRNADSMTGGGGEDRFDFNATTESAGGVTRDTISDFVHLVDRLDLLNIDAIVGGGNDAFSFIGTAAFTAAGQVRAQVSGSDTIIQMNTSGTSGVESSILLAGVTASTLTAADFVL